MRVDRRRRLRPSLLAVIAVVAVIAAVSVLRGLHLVPGWLNPFGEETKDRSSPVVLKSIRDLSRYEAATGNFQVVVDLERDAKFLPDAVRGRRTLFVGNGSVDAFVDFSRLSRGGVAVNADRTAVTVRLPRAQLEPTNLDPKNSYVFATQRGIFNRIGDFFGANPGDQQQLYALAAQKIQTAAQQSGLRERADQNTKLMLENMLRALGFGKVTVTSAAQQ
ncbi:MAG TPA: DUF4230 domain-containing protein [Streptosporangiaceae bacterium]|nr:DUF4230 domain-containing protein [Streptosporangiaceae bacterium]